MGRTNYTLPMISLRRIRAVAVVSALFGISAAVISVIVNVGVWLTMPTSLPRSATFLFVFTPAPLAFAFGCVIGFTFSVLLSGRGGRTDEALSVRRLAIAGLLGGAAVGLVGALVYGAPRDLLSAVGKSLPSVGVFSLIGAVTAGLLGRIARGRGRWASRG